MWYALHENSDKIRLQDSRLLAIMLLPHSILAGTTVTRMNSAPVRVLYLGRQPQIAEDLSALLCSDRAEHVQARQEILPDVDYITASNQKDALRLIRTQMPSIVLVETDGKPSSRVRFCELVRSRTPVATIVALSPVHPHAPEIFDGIILTPIAPDRFWTIINQSFVERSEYQLEQGDVHLNLATRTVVSPNGRYRMTPKQCALLKMLMLNHGATVKRSDIMQAIWETSYLDDTRTLDVHIRWLREYIEPDPSTPVYLRTVRGVGYCLTLNR